MKRRILSMILAGVLVLQSSIGVFAEELIAEGETVFVETSDEETAETIITADAGDEDSCADDSELTFSEIEGAAASDEIISVGNESAEAADGTAEEELSDENQAAGEESQDNLSAETSGSASEMVDETLTSEGTAETTDTETAATDESGEIEFVIEDVMEVDPLEKFGAETSSTNNICGENVYYMISGTVLTIYGTGAMYDYDESSTGTQVPFYSSNPNITEIIVEEGVTRIGNYAFVSAGVNAYLNSNNSAYVRVSLPSTLEEIGEGAFESAAISEITLPNGLKTIEKDAFNGTGLTSITVPDSVMSIGSAAFYNCPNMTSAVLSESITEIPNALFAECYKLTEVTIPESVTKVGYRVFQHCNALERITFPEHITEIG